MEAKQTHYAVYNVPYPSVWCPKYRRKVFTASVAEKLDPLIHSKVVELGGEVVPLEVQLDHVHLFHGFLPTLAGHQILHRIKGFTSYALRQAFSWLKRQIPSPWTRSYYIGTAGEVSAATIHRYIKAHKVCHVPKER